MSKIYSPELCPPPDSFRPAGKVLSAGFCTPPQLGRKRFTGRRLEGVRYERKAQTYLLWLYGEYYVDSPWLRFYADGTWRWCQPDGLHFDVKRGIITIVEMKYQHTPDAWWQVKRLYQPVLEAIFPRTMWQYRACEVVQWYDPDVSFPERVVLAQDVTMDCPGFKVHIYRP